jgi:hypothetical protein
LRLKRENGWQVDMSGRHLECYLGVREKTSSTEV